MTTKLIICLLKLPKIGLKTAHKIIEQSHGKEVSDKDLFHLIQNSKKTDKRIPEIDITKITSALFEADNLIESCSKLGIEIISIRNRNYPIRFRELKTPPLIIYGKGNLNLINYENAIAVIGTREPTNFGRKAGYKLTKYFVENGLIVISGLALGCDTVAHRSCLDHNGKTIAILPNGLDKIYPKENSKLADEILAKGGALISEYPIGTIPRRNNFIQRDRLQSGLSKGICVIESDRESGTMHTTNFAFEQHKIIGALSHPEKYLSSKSNGNKYIIEEIGGYSLGSLLQIENFIKLLKENKKFSLNPQKNNLDETDSQFKLFN